MIAITTDTSFNADLVGGGQNKDDRLTVFYTGGILNLETVSYLKGNALSGRIGIDQLDDIAAVKIAIQQLRGGGTNPPQSQRNLGFPKGFCCGCNFSSHFRI